MRDTVARMARRGAVGEIRGSTPLPRWFTERAIDYYDLDPEDRLVFVMLCSGLRRGSRIAQMSRADLEHRTGLSRSAVFRALKSLRKIRLIRQVAAASGRTPAAYEIPEHMPFPPMDLGPGVSARYEGRGWLSEG